MYESDSSHSTEVYEYDATAYEVTGENRSTDSNNNNNDFSNQPLDDATAKMMNKHRRLSVLLYLRSHEMKGSASEIVDSLNGQFGADYIKLTTVKKWCKEFCVGSTVINDAPRSGRKKDISNEEISKFVESKRGVSTKEIASHFSGIRRLVNRWQEIIDRHGEYIQEH